ncbi:transmembrane emp24 protein transport domain containing 9 [Ectocarpus siliculosus]|uniref:Transmembrane emp24 protein transport domain containing 9 n=1 Tax=Ectocarpus siliculosus TaxID=2880 RepID=D8LDF7_ECTSI|nr:transmembrane emp24 protein transport domain containing 9 [Ectocarpus siliculosus]|eukprot:CBN74022.1 transmembrane emp24 protein transport domain containing 9 [Ectocarpus siliculosus]
MARPCAVATTGALQAARIQETTTATSTAALASSRRRPLSLPLLPFVFATLVVFLGGGIVRPVASENPLVPASGKLTVGEGDGGGGAGSRGADEEEEEDERPPEGMYFFVSPKGPRRCFVVSEAPGTTFHVHHYYPKAEDGHKITLELRTLSEDSSPKDRFVQEPLVTRDIEDKRGSHQFKIKTAEDHLLCAVTSSETKNKDRGLKLYLDLDTGLEDKHYKDVQRKFNLEDAQITMIQLKNEAQQMLREADLSKKSETEYHQTSPAGQPRGLVVACIAGGDPGGDGVLPSATPQELLRVQAARLAH